MHALFRRLRARIKYRHFERDLAREVEQHRDMAERDARADGRDPREARYAASRILGNTTIAREDSRAMWIPLLLQQFAQDVRYALRGLRRQPTFSISACATLVLGLSLSACLFTIFSVNFVRPWPLPEAHRVVIAESDLMADHLQPHSDKPAAGRTVFSRGFPFSAFRQIQQSARTTDYVFSERELFQTPFAIRPGVSVVQGAFVSDNFIEVLQIPIQLGPGFGSNSRTFGPVVLISDVIWRSVFGRDPGVIGRTLELSRVPTTIVGVIGKSFDGLPPTELNVIVAASGAGAWPTRAFAQEWKSSDPLSCCVDLAGRLQSGATIEDARSELAHLMTRYQAENGLPQSAVTMTGTRALDRRDLGPELQRLYSLLAIGCVLILLLACANVGNLELARGLQRQREVVVRLSLGAGRARIVRQLLAEGLTLGAISGVLAFGVTWISPAWIMRTLSPPPARAYTPDINSAIFVGLTATAAAVLFSLLPALQTTRIHWRGSTAVTTAKIGRARGVVLGAQIAASAALVLAACLLARSVIDALNDGADFAIDAVSVATFTPPSGDDDYSNSDQLKAVWARVVQAMALNGLPFAVTARPPIDDHTTFSTVSTDDGLAINTEVLLMSSPAMTMLKVPTIAGRLYSDDPSLNEIVVNEQLAAQLWPGRSPIGQTVTMSLEQGKYTVVGVVRDTHLLRFGPVPTLVHRLPYRRGVSIRLQALVPRDPAVAAAVAAEARRVAPRVNLSIVPLADSIRGNLSNAIAGAWIASGLAGTALLLAIVGVFGVFAFAVEERRKEIGIRLALGAGRRQVGYAILSLGRWPIVSGLAVGLVLSLIASSALRGYLLRISPLDVRAYVMTAAVLTAGAAVAIAIPVLRALRVDPAITLRSE